MNRRKVFTASTLCLAIVPAVMLLGQSPAGAQDSGADLFQKKCGTCHSDAAPAAVKGPALKGVFGRSIAAEKGYAYSDGLKAKASQKWTQGNLDGYLTKPKEWAPGSKMPVGVADAAERAKIIEVLKTLK